MSLLVFVVIFLQPDFPASLDKEEGLVMDWQGNTFPADSRWP